MLEPTAKALLSQEETLALLALLNIQALPGLPASSAYGSPASQMVALGAGERSLRARGLARIDAAGRFQAPADLLALVAACGYAQGSVIINQVAGGVTRGCFGHRRDTDLVLHTLPEAGLHQFEAALNKADLVTAIAQWADWRAEPQDPASPLTVHRPALEAARAAAEAGDGIAAQKLLAPDVPATPAAVRFAASLGQPYVLTVVQALQAGAPGSVEVETISVLTAVDQQWVITEVGAAETSDPDFVIEAATRTALIDRIMQLAW
jgi:hypothetical protein